MAAKPRGPERTDPLYSVAVRPEKKGFPYILERFAPKGANPRPDVCVMKISDWDGKVKGAPILKGRIPRRAFDGFKRLVDLQKAKHAAHDYHYANTMQTLFRRAFQEYQHDLQAASNPEFEPNPKYVPQCMLGFLFRESINRSHNPADPQGREVDEQTSPAFTAWHADYQPVDMAGILWPLPKPKPVARRASQTPKRTVDDDDTSDVPLESEGDESRGEGDATTGTPVESDSDGSTRVSKYNTRGAGTRSRAARYLEVKQGKFVILSNAASVSHSQPPQNPVANRKSVRALVTADRTNA
jgi:hypothetical protein